jgi:hypothetical protein
MTSSKCVPRFLEGAHYTGARYWSLYPVVALAGLPICGRVPMGV